VNRSDLRTLVIGATSRSDKSDLINTALNLALTELDQEQVWRELRSTLDVSVVSGDDHIDLPSSVGKVQEVRFINGQSSSRQLRPVFCWLCSDTEKI
jgi:hypothetical protein